MTQKLALAGATAVVVGVRYDHIARSLLRRQKACVMMLRRRAVSVAGHAGRTNLSVAAVGWADYRAW